MNRLNILAKAMCHSGEQILWTEQSGPQNLDPIMWPRAAASAEVFWSAKQPSGAPLDAAEALPRLHVSIPTCSQMIRVLPSANRISDTEWYNVGLVRSHSSPSGALFVLMRAIFTHEKASGRFRF